VPSIAEFIDPDLLSRKGYLTDSVDFSFYSEASEHASINEIFIAHAQQIPDALAAIKHEVAMFGRWIGIAVTIIAVIAVLFYLCH
jgi:hypothetical protein